eukprot:SAG11_NODE_2302_length_3548_cov_2.637866_2_plen_175_part_00
MIFSPYLSRALSLARALFLSLSHTHTHSFSLSLSLSLSLPRGPRRSSLFTTHRAGPRGTRSILTFSTAQSESTRLSVRPGKGGESPCGSTRACGYVRLWAQPPEELGRPCVTTGDARAAKFCILTSPTRSAATMSCSLEISSRRQRVEQPNRATHGPVLRMDSMHHPTARPPCP